jgi:hypothetical protein
MQFFWTNPLQSSPFSKIHCLGNSFYYCSTIITLKILDFGFLLGLSRDRMVRLEVDHDLTKLYKRIYNVDIISFVSFFLRGSGS